MAARDARRKPPSLPPTTSKAQHRVDQIRRLIDIAILDTLALDNGVNRNRTLAYLAQTAVKLLDVGEYEELLERIDSVLAPRLVRDRR